MAKPYISKQRIKDFIYDIYCEKRDEIYKKESAAINKAVDATESFKRLEDALNSARTIAEEIKQIGFGDAFLNKIPTLRSLASETISRSKYMYSDPLKSWSTICEIVKPFEEQLSELSSAKCYAYRIIENAQNGRAAADALKEQGLDFYSWQKKETEENLDISALKGGD
jgi:hypothetical protein|nr:MAG TPA: hypothetical protein [Caudoviricetes sp.]